MLSMCSTMQCRAGLTSAEDVLKVVQAFDNEVNYTVWSNLSGNLAGFRHILQVGIIRTFLSLC